MQRINVVFRVNHNPELCATIPGGTIVGPVIEIQIVKTLVQYGLEVAISVTI